MAKAVSSIDLFEKLREFSNRVRVIRVGSKGSISFKVLPDDKIVPASQGDSILDAILKAKIEIDHSCGGMGTCGTCRIYVTSGLDKFAERGELEQEIALDREFQPEERLACQNLAMSEIQIRRP